MIEFLREFALKAREVRADPDKPLVWLEVDPAGIIVKAQFSGERCSYILGWEEISRTQSAVHSAMIDYAIYRAIKPFMDRKAEQEKAR